MKKAKLIFDEQQVKEQIYRTRKLKCKKISKNFIIFRFEKNAFYRNDHYIYRSLMWYKDFYRE